MNRQMNLGFVGGFLICLSLAGGPVPVRADGAEVLAPTATENETAGQDAWDETGVDVPMPEIPDVCEVSPP